ncbi:hypothetical protein PoB_001060100 [Plakobranchus ocellatus]|uniref:Uncharacterized protein n=1 Tax=Plakobranchus ocellatus TaxID=259542 RepID=A0AAV3YA12_9GAST|nr:hypothetical protein PoB_001060100 [Plakobranchus ocellatus]
MRITSHSCFMIAMCVIFRHGEYGQCNMAAQELGSPTIILQVWLKTFFNKRGDEQRFEIWMQAAQRLGDHQEIEWLYHRNPIE